MTNEDKLVSIVLPTYNGARYLAESIESILQQTYSNWELIIVDDCSTDDTPDMIARYVAQDERIRSIRHETNKKLPGGLNTGFRAAQGAYFTWTSDDNLYLPDALRVMVKHLEKNPDVGLVYTDFSYIDETGEITGSFVAGPPGMLVYKACVGACFLYRREVMEEIGEYDEARVLAEDYDYWLRILRHFKIQPLHQDLYRYRMHGGSLTERRKQQVQEQREILIRHHLPHLSGIVGRANMARAFIRLAPLAAARGDSGQAKKDRLQALRWSPVIVLRHGILHIVGALFGKQMKNRLSRAYVRLKQQLRMNS